MKNMNMGIRITIALLIVAAAAMLFTYEYPPIESTQWGYRGTGMATVENPRTIARQASFGNEVPEVIPKAPDTGPRAADVYENVKVLGDLSVGQFTRVMQAMTEWVAPEEGCTYCHAAGNFASDKPYAKKVARRMLQMTRHINSGWKKHVGRTGVTCYTCHRGQPVPAYVWHRGAYIGGDFLAPSVRQAGLARDHTGQNHPSTAAAYASLPYDPFTEYLLGKEDILVQSDTALPTATGDARQNPMQHTERTYAFMMHISDSLGVNCTYCHNSRSFMPWEQSTPFRAKAWYGIRMARELNNNYVQPLTKTLPPSHRGPLGDALKVNCATCHQGVNKPLNGVSMLKDYPELAAAGAAAKAVPAPKVKQPTAKAPGSKPAAKAKSSPSAAGKPAPPQAAGKPRQKAVGRKAPSKP